MTDLPDSAAERESLPRWAREVLGVAVAIAVGIAVVAVAASARSELLFRDGDSLVTTLIVRSIAAGQPQDWALSTVLFLPETAVLAVLSLFGLGVNGTLAVAGVVNVVGLYGALRVAAGRVGPNRMPVTGALLALGAFGLVAVSESSPSRDALELASLLTTTTYYSATVIAVVLVIGLARRALDGPDLRSGVGTRGNPGSESAEPDPRARDAAPWGVVVGIGLVAAASVVTNPMFAVWATVPLGVVLAVVAAWRRSAVALWLVGALVGGTAIGFVGRMPLARLIANTGAGYADLSRWLESLDYYGALLGERWNAPWGAASVVFVVGLWTWSVVATVLLTRRREVGAAVVAACGCVMPLLVVIGAIALGTHAARYLQPVVFAPVLGLVVLPMLLPARTVARSGAVLAVCASAVGLVIAAAVGIPRITVAASAPDADLACVVDWVDGSGRTGGGQFWTVRLPKTHLADPAALVQVDHQLRGYAWLVNRDDFTVGEVSFLVMDAQSPPFDLPGDTEMQDAETVACGRYTIFDFGDPQLPIGPLRS